MPFSAYNKIQNGTPHRFASIIIQNRGKRKGILLFPRFYFSAVSIHPAAFAVKSGVRMIDIKAWIGAFTDKVEAAFPNRVWFIGLQGSYGRGEATDTSDIDVVVILNELDITDLGRYRDMLDTLPYREQVCGFVSGRAELLSWEPSDLFQFYHDTTPIKGSLDALLGKIKKEDTRRAVHIGACNLYHALVHNFLHEKSDAVLRSLYKSAVFVIQAVHFCRTGEYIKSTKELLFAADMPEKAILETARELKSGGSAKLEPMTDALLAWTKTILEEYRA